MNIKRSGFTRPFYVHRLYITNQLFHTEDAELKAVTIPLERYNTSQLYAQKKTDSMLKSTIKLMVIIYVE